MTTLGRFIVSAIVLFGSVTRILAQNAWPSDTELSRNWASFRGPGLGVVSADVATDWDGPSGRNILWKTAVPLPGKNSPIIWNDSIFLSGATKERQEIFCYNAATGALRWRSELSVVDPSKPPKVMEDAGYAAPTMATDGKRAFAIFATGDVLAVDFSGKIVWSVRLGMPDNIYGHASSLVMWHDRLIVQFDQGLEAKSAKSYLYALDAANGSIAWKTARPVANSWTSPIIIEAPQGPQIITAANPWIIAYDPEQGAEIWRAKGLEGDVAPSPTYADGIVFSAMENSMGCAIKVGGTGDVTKTHMAWTVDRELPDIVSPIGTGRYFFTTLTFGTVACYQASDGKKLWDHEFDGPFHATPLVIGNVVNLIDRAGVMHRFEAAGEFKLLNKPILGEPVSATPAVVSNKIYIRGESNLYCIGTK